jgi:hypothetical protein
MHQFDFRCVLEQAGEIGAINWIVLDHGSSLG